MSKPEISPRIWGWPEKSEAEPSRSGDFPTQVEGSLWGTADLNFDAALVRAREILAETV